MRQGDAGVVVLSFCELQPWTSGGDSYSRVCLPMAEARRVGSLEVLSRRHTGQSSPVQLVSRCLRPLRLPG